MELFYLVLFVCYASYAYNRKSVVFSMPMLKEEGLDPSHAGLIISCQNIAFSINQFLAGILSDTLSPQWLFATGLLVSGTATLAFSSSSSVTVFCCLWFMNGIAQGCGWPPLAKILSERASPSEFGTLWSFLSASQNFSGILGPFLSAYFIVHYGWRWNVFIAGCLTLCLCALFLVSVPFLFHSTKAKVQDKRSPSPEKKDGKTTIWDLLRDPFTWLLSISYMVVFCARTTTVDWGQMYLMEEKGHSQYVGSAFTSSVESGGFVGRMAAGYLTDWVIKRSITSAKQGTPSKPVLRMSVALAFVLGSVVSLNLFRFAISEESSSSWITCIGALMGMSYYGPIAIFGIVSAEAVPTHLSGSSHAIVALFGNIGATISGLPFSYIAKYYEWSTVFLMLTILLAVNLLFLFRFRKMSPKIGKTKED